jgi:hypothetical protein
MADPNPSFAYWHRQPALERCWSNNCESKPAEHQDERWRGRYCAPCLEILERETAMAEGERVLIYGSRGWNDSNAIRDAVHELPRDAVVIHGGAPGADTLAGQWAKANGMKVKVYRADWKKHGKGAGPIRNQQMIDEGKPTRALGFRLPGDSPGTDDMTRRLERAGIPHTVTLAPSAGRIAVETGGVVG